MKTHLNPERGEWEKLFKRPKIASKNMLYAVKEVFANVKMFGDEAVKKYTNFFEKVVLEDFKVSEQEFDKASRAVDNCLKDAIRIAKNNIFSFHNLQRKRPVIMDNNGINCWQEKRPIQKVGLYVPGGDSPLFSTVLMLTIPAKIAGCKKIILCTPPNIRGEIADEILYTAQYCGVEDVYKIGGIQAIAAMTFGTDTIEKVYKIFGPGDEYITAAKRYATDYNVAIDSLSGPSDLLIMADDMARADFIAADLLSQTDQGANCQMMLITTSQNLINNVKIEIYKQVENLPQKDIKQTLSNADVVYVDSPQIALEMINEYAPETLILSTENLDFYVNGIENSGTVFIGSYAPKSAGYYATGANHILPTYGFSKNCSGVNLDSFTKTITFQEISEQGLRHIAPVIEVMAEAGQHHAHKNAVSIRMNSDNV